MAEDWKELVRNSYSGSYANGGGLIVVIQYDKNSITTTSVKLRTKAWFPSGNSSTDTYFIYSDGGGIGRICYLAGHGTGGSGNRGSNPYYSNHFTLSKTNTDTKFTMPAVKICNDGQHRAASAYTDSNGRGASVYWGSGRVALSSVLNSGGTDLTTTVYVTNVGTGTTTITDNYNNTFKITATKGIDGDYNAAGGPTNLKYGYSTTTRNTGYTSGSNIGLSLSGTDNTRTVYAESTTTATYLNSKTATAQKAIRQYKAPNAPGIPALTADSYKNNRLTVKKNWTWTWTASTPGTGTGTTIGTESNQTTSKVKGYRVLLFKKSPGANGFSSIPIKEGTTTKSTYDSKAKEYYLDISTNSLTINPVDCGIAPGDYVKLGVRPYTQYGKNNDGAKLVSTTTTAPTDANANLVKNAGVMRVKPNNTVGWKEGVVWVKVNKNGTVQWVEADVVKYKTANGWKESV